MLALIDSWKVELNWRWFSITQFTDQASHLSNKYIPTWIAHCNWTIFNFLMIMFSMMSTTLGARRAAAAQSGTNEVSTSRRVQRNNGESVKRCECGTLTNRSRPQIVRQKCETIAGLQLAPAPRALRGDAYVNSWHNRVDDRRLRNHRRTRNPTHRTSPSHRTPHYRPKLPNCTQNASKGHWSNARVTTLTTPAIISAITFCLGRWRTKLERLLRYANV